MDNIYWQPGVKLEDVEKAVILKAYRWYQNNKTHTAQALGIAIRTLDNKLALYEGKKPNVEIESTGRVDAQSGDDLEPALATTAQHALPVSEQQKVQNMSSQPTTPSGKPRRR